MLEQSIVDDLIKRKFRELNSRREAALVAYLTGGDPDEKSFLENSIALVKSGADILEVGIPFSDPIADGPVIQASSGRAFSSGATPAKVLDSVKELSSQFPRFPFVVLSYYNPILAMGVERFLDRSMESGISGVVVPDLPVEEADIFRATALERGVDHILLAAPNTSGFRLEKIVEKSKGFLYLVSLYGVTGPRDTLSPEAVETVGKVKELSKGRIPLAVGFGISNPEQVEALVRAGADGVIVGSALVRVVSQHLDDRSETPNHLRNLISELKLATRSRVEADLNLG